MTPNHYTTLTHFAERLKLKQTQQIDPATLSAIKTAILAQFAQTATDDNPNSSPTRLPSHQQDWYLLGTDGCHLCHQAGQMIEQAFAISPTPPRLLYLDLADGGELLIDLLGWHIPLVLTPSRLLGYPFGVMDLVAILME